MKMINNNNGIFRQDLKVKNREQMNKTVKAILAPVKY